MTVKLIDLKNAKSVSDFSALWIICFPEDDVKFIKDYINRRLIYNNAMCFGIYEGDLLVSMLSIIPEQTYCDNMTRLVNSGFIVGVGTHTAYRGKGYSRRLMEYAIQYIEQQTDICVLQLSTEIPEFYVKMGFSSYSQQNGNDQIISTDDTGVIIVKPEAVTYEIAQKLLSCYERTAKDGYFKKCIGKIMEMVYYCDEIIIKVSDDGKYEACRFVDYSFENVSTVQMMRNIKGEYIFTGNPENY